MKQSMIWTNELILLAPRILQKRSPLEHKNFIGLYTSIKDEYSKGFVYLLYQFNDFNQEKHIEGLLNNTEWYYNKRVIYVSNLRYVIFIFKKEDVEIHKNYGNIGYDINDYTLIYTFWGDRNKEINWISNTIISVCKSEMDKEKGFDVISSPLLFYSPSICF